MKKLRRIANFFAVLGLVSLLVYRFWPTPVLPPEVLADRIVISKQSNQMVLYQGSAPLKTYRVALGSRSGPKEKQGDRRTPEGDYVVDYKNPQSQYYKALHLSYPNARDLARAKAKGLNPGGDIMIHGLSPTWAWVGRVHNLIDYTAGCVAVSNKEMDELWRAVPVGVKVSIRP
jgi:murein L,D-transpeptidase YafK